ncbi:nicotinate-nicotinamide nucleotide adenylyltransferase [Helicobacter sp. 23-1045]
MNGDFGANVSANQSAKMGANLMCDLNLAIFGGSFNPPHKGHCAIIKSAIECEFIDFLIILPNFKNPLKHESTPFLSDDSRFEILESMAQKIAKSTNATFYKNPPNPQNLAQNLTQNHKKIILLSNFESAQKKPNFAIHSILHFKELYAPKNLYFIIGADILGELDKWHKIDEIRQNVQFIVATRDNIPIPSEFLQLQIDENISSTAIRNDKIQGKNGTNLAK